MKKKKKLVYGLTLIELLIAAFAAAIIVLSLGLVLVDNQKGYTKLFNRVHGEVATDSDTARRAFDSIVRKSSASRSLLDVDGKFVEVYYFNNSASLSPDRYAFFYLNGNTLMVDRGDYNWAARTKTKTSDEVLARNVSAVQFSVLGASVHMVLYLDDKKETETVMTSAVRHN